MSLTSSPSHDILTKLLKSSVDKAIYRKNSRSEFLHRSSAAVGPLVKRLRHRPFTAVTWVQFPQGSFDGSRSHRNKNREAVLEGGD